MIIGIDLLMIIRGNNVFLIYNKIKKITYKIKII